MLSFKQLQEKKTKIKINPKKEDVMEGDKTLNHGEDCGCMKCDKKRRKDELGDEKSVSTEQKIYDSNKEVSEESTESNAESDNTETNLLTFEKFHKFKKKKQEDEEKPESYIETKMEETEYHVMSKKSFKKLHKDFKGGTKDKPRATVGVTDKMGNTTPVSRLVKFSEAKYERGASNYGKMSIRNKRAVGYGGNAAPPEERRKAHDERMKKHRLKKVDECWKTHKQQGYKKKGGKMVPNCVPKNEEVQFEATRYAKETGKSFKSGKPMVKGGTAKDDKAFQAVAKKYAGQMMGGQQKKKVRGQKPDESNTPFKRAAARVKQIKVDNKALADKAKKAGYKSTQDYVNVQAVRKGGLGT